MNAMPDPMASMMAGLAAGVMKTVVGHPFNTWKVHRQSGLVPPRRLGELYRGLHAPLGRSAVEHGLHMGFRDLVMQQMMGAGLHDAAQNPFLVGLLAGIPQAIAVAPMDYACTRLQLSKNVQWRNCFHGLSWAIGKEMLAGMIFFGIYDTTRAVPELEKNAGARGAMAAVAAMVTTYPLDTLKTRLQAGICSRTAPAALHAGLGFSLLKCVVANYMALMVYDASRQRIQAFQERRDASPPNSAV